jgi:hypothetical protein
MPIGRLCRSTLASSCTNAPVAGRCFGPRPETAVSSAHLVQCPVRPFRRRGLDATRMDEILLRIVLHDPLPDVTMRVQRGRDELVAPIAATAAEFVFEVPLRLGTPLEDGSPNFLGAYAQGRPRERFLYVNSGKQAGQPDSCWDRRAKVSLGGITWSHIDQLRASPGHVLAGHIAGAAADGGPACARVPLLGAWQVVAAQPRPQAFSTS